jgi:zinc D-Ala-D-Ala carboxypeptidase
MQIQKIGTPKVTVTILTEDSKHVLTATLGDMNTDILSVSTNKDIVQPHGTFDIQLVPRLDSEGLTWADKLDPFDYVEINFMGNGDSDFEVVMRGLIESVHTTETWEDGVPRRSISISGSDLGLFLTQFEVIYVPELNAVEAMKAKVQPWDVKDSYFQLNAEEIFEFIMKKFVVYMNISVGGSKLLNRFKYAAKAMFPDDTAPKSFLTGFQGPFWNAFSQYQDKPFHELFVYDPPGENASWLIMRPSRLKDVVGDFPKQVMDLEKDQSIVLAPEVTMEDVMGAGYFGGSTADVKVEKTVKGSLLYPPNFAIKNTDIVSMDMVKNKDEIFNYFYTCPEGSPTMKVDMQGTCVNPYRDDIKRCENPYFQLDPTLPAFVEKYGIKKYELTSVFLDLYKKGRQFDRGMPLDQLVGLDTVQRTIIRNRTAVAWFLQNEHLLKGSITIAGTNKALIGTYVTDEDSWMEYYVEGVAHNFVRFQSFTTTLRVERGMPTAGLGAWSNKYFFGTMGSGNVYRVVPPPTESTKLGYGEWEVMSAEPPAAQQGVLPKGTVIRDGTALSDHFTLRQFLVSDQARIHHIQEQNFPPGNVVQNLKTLCANILEPLRKALPNGNITVNSGYRCQAVNNLVGGVYNSQHLTGEAADIIYLDENKKKDNHTLIGKIRELTATGKITFDQMINESSYAWVHISYSARGTNRKWEIGL